MVFAGMVLRNELYGKPSIANAKSSDLKSLFVVHTGSVKPVASPHWIGRVAVLMCARSMIWIDHLVPFL
jgi:hypothetical protein